MSTDRSLLPASWDIPQVFRDRLGLTAGRQRAMVHEGHLLLVLHGPPSDDHAARGGRFFWRSPDGTWSAAATGKPCHSLDAHLAEYEEIVAEIDERDPADENAGELHADIPALSPLVRASRNQHAALQHARELLAGSDEILVCRDRAYQIERMAELAYQDAQNTLGYTTALQAEAQATAGHQMAVSAHRLNILAAFFFPMATLSAIFGVNLGSGLEKQWIPLPFLALVGISVVCGFVLKGFIAAEAPKPPAGSTAGPDTGSARSNE